VGRRLVTAAFAAGLCFVVFGSPGAPAADAQSVAQARAVHVATGAAAVDIAINGEQVAGSLAPRSASGYSPVPAGSQNLRVTPTGQPGQSVLESDVTIQANTQVTLAVLGEVPSVNAIVLRDDNSPPPAGQAKVRFVHGVPDAPPVNVVTRQGQALFGGVAYRNAADYVTVPAGTYDLELRAADQSGVLVTVPNVTLSAGEIVTLFATGKAADNSLAAVPVTYQAGATGGAGAPLPAAMPRTGAGMAVDAGGRVGAPALPVALALLAAAGLLLRRAHRRHA
jgi:hypothetical protein